MLAVAPHPADERALALVVQGAVFADFGAHAGDASGCIRVGDGTVGERRDGGFAHREEGHVVVGFAAGEEEDDGETAAAGSACAAGAVEEGFGFGRGVELDGEVDGGDVEAAGGDVGC